MRTSIPSVADVQGTLLGLSGQQLQVLSGLSKVPLTTLYNIRSNKTENPGLDTVAAFMRHVASVKRLDLSKPARRSKSHQPGQGV